MEKIEKEIIFRGKRIDEKLYSEPLWPFLKRKMESFGGRTALRIIVIGPRDGNLNYLDLLALGSGDVTLPPPPADPSKVVATLLCSSGTTGLPKGVQISQRNALAFIVIYEAFDGRQMDEKDTVMLFLPFFHVYGQVVTLLTGLAHGCRHVVMSKFEMVPFLTFCQRYKVTILYLVPPVIIGMVNFPELSKYDLSTVRMVTAGSAPLGKEVEQQFVKKLNLPCMLSGDMARIDADGYLYIVDRLKELIKFKGEQVAPAVLEDLLMAHPELSDVCVIGLPDPVAGELPRAYVVRTPGSKVTEQEVKDFVAKQVPSYMQLRGGVEFRENIPKSPSGKILRRLLRDELKQQQKSRL
nr:hypothetical protein BaRGS_027031 [Batillaria attramentaria]